MSLRFSKQDNMWQVDCDHELCPSCYRCSRSFVQEDRYFVKKELAELGWQVRETDLGREFYCPHHKVETSRFF